jgi:hypothetical protein
MSEAPVGALEERVSLVLVVGAVIAIALAGYDGVVHRGGPFANQLQRVTDGFNPVVAVLLFLAVVVIVLTPGGEIGRDGQRALKAASVVGALTVLGAVLGAASVAAQNSSLQIWLQFVVPQAVAVVPAGLATRLAQQALRGV